MVEERVNALEIMMAKVRDDLNEFMTKFGTDKIQFMDGINLEFVKQQNSMNEVVQQAASQFEVFRGELQGLHSRTEQAVINLDIKIVELEKKTQGHGQGQAQGAYRGYVPQKSTIPDNFSGKSEDWRAWQEEVMDYFDSIRPGMKKLLEEVEKMDEAANEQWRRRNRRLYDQKLMDDGLEIRRALKKLTTGEARKILNNVKE